jgi:hypothetical protein
MSKIKVKYVSSWTTQESDFPFCVNLDVGQQVTKQQTKDMVDWELMTEFETLFGLRCGEDYQIWAPKNDQPYLVGSTISEMYHYRPISLRFKNNDPLVLIKLKYHGE